MAGILDLLNSDLGKTIISGVSGQTGAPQNKTADLLSMAMPVLMGAMQKNASTPEGAQGLLGAVMGKHDGGILDNLGGLFQGGVDDAVMQDGDNILGHVLGAKKTNVEAALSQKSGLDMSQVAQIMKVAAPILMGVIGKQARQQNVSNQNDLSSVLGGLLGGGDNANKQQSLIESFLDADGDGSILDDVAGMVLNSGSAKKGLGGLLGGLFGK
ncbi:MAG: DUF937 domain-containing protein [Cytophagales bacterium]|nr:DUF937 domain-containing protein [Cytophagales bacterium]